MASNFWEDIEERIEASIASVQQALGKGAAEDYPAYREDVGRIRGLRSALQELNDLRRKYTEDHDE